METFLPKINCECQKVTLFHTVFTDRSTDKSLSLFLSFIYNYCFVRFSCCSLQLQTIIVYIDSLDLCVKLLRNPQTILTYMIFTRIATADVINIIGASTSKSRVIQRIMAQYTSIAVMTQIIRTDVIAPSTSARYHPNDIL